MSLYDPDLAVGTALEWALTEVGSEVLRAQSLYGSTRGIHEGYAILLEELEEYWDEVKAAKVNALTPAMRKELIQVAAMAIRVLLDVPKA